MGFFSEKIVVITGATSGIGEAVAKGFYQEGATVILVGRNEERGENLSRIFCSNGGSAEFVKCDVSNEAEVSRFSEYIEKKYGRVNVLVNNAGVMLPSCEIEKMPADDWKRTFEINLDSMFYVTRNLKKAVYNCKGNIINIASIAGSHSYVTGKSYAYSASKAAVIQFTRQMAKNYASDGVRVNCICPGIIDTPILGDRDRKTYAERIPLGYVGKTEDVANVILFLASDKASYLTGVVLPVDGGVHI